MSNPSIIVDLAISADEYLRFYQGSVKLVSAIAIDGRRVQFPANILQKMVSREGIYGRFIIEFNREGKFQQIQRIG